MFVDQPKVELGTPCIFHGPNNHLRDCSLFP